MTDHVDSTSAHYYPHVSTSRGAWNAPPVGGSAPSLTPPHQKKIMVKISHFLQIYWIFAPSETNFDPSMPPPPTKNFWCRHCTKFHHCSPYRTLDICLFLLLANQKGYATEVLNMRIRWRQTTWIVLVHHYPHTKFYEKSVIAFILRLTFFVEMLTRNLHRPYIHPYIHTDRQTDNVTTKI